MAGHGENSYFLIHTGYFQWISQMIIHLETLGKFTILYSQILNHTPITSLYQLFSLELSLIYYFLSSKLVICRNRVLGT